jgi:prefoldin alpha subunit
MAVDSPQFIDSAIKVYNVEVHRAIKAQEEQLSQVATARGQLQQTIQMLEELPGRLRHPAMIPLGKHAFFPGQLTRTNEVMVHLGDQYYVETTAATARGILQRKLEVLSSGVSKAEQQLQALKGRLDVTQSSLQSSLREGTGNEDAFEIRSSIEESDALLASAASRRKQAAAVRQQQQQQQQQCQGPVTRVRTAAGYSYTPLALSQEEQPQQQQQDPEDAALQARLEELIRLEEQQEAAVADQHDPSWVQQQQQQQHQQQQLASIQEGNEEDEGEEPAATSKASRGPVSAAASSTGLQTAAGRLQHLEEQTDSDDVDSAQHSLGTQMRQQQQQQQQRGSLISEVVERQVIVPQQQQVGQEKQVNEAAAAAANTAPSASRAPLKSALKKGFLMPQSKPKASGSSSSSSSSSSTSSSTVTPTGSKTGSSKAQKSNVTAFTGAVVERPTPAAADSGPSAVVERVPLAAPAPANTSSSAASKPSKFKLRRMGLEP